MSKRCKGEVKWFSPTKGYGFIVYNDKDVFIHYSEVQMEGFKTLNKGDMVEFDLKEADKGLQCGNVVKVES